jgi:anti-sigma factor RsiW
MNVDVTREVVMDLLPVYLSGEASPPTRAVVESFLQQDPELAQRIRGQWFENMTRAVPAVLPPELELAAFRRTRRLLSWQRWLIGFGMFFTAFGLSIQVTFSDGRLQDFHFLARDHPVAFAVCAAIAVSCWAGHFALRRALRSVS